MTARPPGDRSSSRRPPDDDGRHHGGHDDRPGTPDRAEITDDVVAGREPGTAVLRGQSAATVAVALGGALGALARWGVGLAWPTTPGTFPTATVAINVVGCLLMGVLVVHVAEVRTAHPLVRPFLGVGVLGGFTTFSVFAADAHALLAGNHLGLGLASIVVTAGGSVAAAALGLVLARRTSGATDAGGAAR